MGDGKSDPTYDAQNTVPSNEAGYIPPRENYDPGTVAAPKRSIEEAAAQLQPEVERELQALEATMERLVGTTDAYLKQLSPILAPERDEIEKTTTAPANEVYPQSPVGERVRYVRDRLIALNYRVSSAQGRTKV